VTCKVERGVGYKKKFDWIEGITFANVSGGTGGGGRRIVEQEGGLIERGPKPYCRYRGGAAREGNLQRIRRNDTGLRADGSAMLRTSTTATLLGIANATTKNVEGTRANRRLL
jgi:hypothetical protein